jgi:multiple sugar transport system substrate-binding protein
VGQDQDRTSSERIAELLDGVMSGRLSRRTFLARSAALGAAASMAGGLASAGRVAAQDAAYDPMKYAGTKLSILMTGSENDHRALADLLPQLKEETGIELEISALALDALIPKTAQELAAPQSAFELIEYLGFLTTGYMKNGSFLQLNEFKDDPSRTPADWDFDDFADANLNNVGIFDPATGMIGEGDKLFGIPGLHSGSVVYFYRTDLFEAAGLAAPTDWDQVMAAAQALKTDDVAGISFIGANDFSLATVDWYTRFITTGGQLMSGSPADKDFKPNLTSPEAVGALQMLIDYLPYAPENVTSYGFAENVDGFSAGRIAQMIFWSTIAGPVFNPETSMVADVTGVTLVPANEGFEHRAILGGWGTGIPANVDPAKKDAAWLALTWITNKATNNYFTEAYQIDASRDSTYVVPELVAQFPYLPVAGEANAKAQPIETTILDDFFGMNAVMNVEFNKALIGDQDASTACANVQVLWEDSLRKAGVLA